MRERRAAAVNGETARRVGPGMDLRSGRRAEGWQALVLRGRERVRETTELTGNETPCGSGGPDPAFRHDALAHRGSTAPAERMMMGAHTGSTSRGEAGDGARREWKHSMLGVWTGRK